MGASKAALENLHNKLAETLAEALAERDEDGKLNASLLNVARAFLKDNNIELKPGTTNSAMSKLTEALPFPGEDGPNGEEPIRH